MILSIIIPVYKVERYIQNCISSIYSQDISENEFEVIIVNDGTPDKSIELISPIIGQKTNAQIIHQKNQGLSIARNNGLKIAKGKYVWFIDSDDTLLPGAIKKILKVLNNHTEIDVIATILLQKKETNGVTKLEYTPDFSVKTGREYMFQGNHLGASQRYIIKREFLLNNNLSFMPNVYHEDGEFGHKMMYLAKTVYVMSEPVYCYLLRSSGSITSTRKMKMNYDLITIYKSLVVFCNEKVEVTDKWKFLSLAANCVYDTILFSRRVIFSKEFKEYYHNNKALIHQVAGQLLYHYNEIGWKNYKKALHFYFFPLMWTRTKSLIKLIIKK